MSPLELALRHMKVIFDGLDPESLQSLLSDSFSFEGPLFRTDSKKEYIQSLMKAPPQDVSYKMISMMETESQAILFYEFQKP